MSKRFSITTFRPWRSSFDVIRLDADWQRPYKIFCADRMEMGWFCVTAVLLGFGVSLTYWRHPKRPDVYGDGGVA